MQARILRVQEGRRARDGCVHLEVRIVRSETKIVIHQNDMNPAGMAGEACDQELTADCVWGFAVHTGAGLGARCINTDPYRIDRSGNIAGTLHRRINILSKFIHTDDKNDFFRTLCNCRNTVGISVDIDQIGRASCRERV